MQKARLTKESVVLLYFTGTACGIAFLQMPPRWLASGVKNLPRVSVAFSRDRPAALAQNKRIYARALWQCF